ncbi:hypothetical protein EXIGLDRAFT_292804 [Exidia glandulosa HHB12029]|uniref:Transmembrane protein n=1 Tax=Exidia glandulosa HHB12029 TaxID=1314781 RepID=A0A165M1L5_EXIGL|nr:hypothetical protein EXIGLDRAFT_292804 [Exidia glandulosa HHB12029]
MSSYVPFAFGVFCILTAPPFIGIPFPTRRAADYYASKNDWLSSLSGRRESPTQAGYLGAVMRVLLGLGLSSPQYRRVSCVFMLAVVGPGTVFAVRDGKPLLPQFGMLAAIAACWIIRS